MLNIEILISFVSYICKNGNVIKAILHVHKQELYVIFLIGFSKAKQMEN